MDEQYYLKNEIWGDIKMLFVVTFESKPEIYTNYFDNNEFVTEYSNVSDCRVLFQTIPIGKYFYKNSLRHYLSFMQ